MNQGFGDIAQTLLNNGYTPIPIRYGTKKPIKAKWETTDYSNSPKEVKSLIKEFPDASTGIVLGQVCVIDIDVLDADAARVCKEIVISKLGDAPCRVGKPPKSALFFRVQGPTFPKLTTKVYEIKGQKTQVEILCFGQQAVVFGKHPETQKPYYWTAKSILDVSVAELPTISKREAAQLIRDLESELALKADHPIAASFNPTAAVLRVEPCVASMGDKENITGALSFIDPQDYEDWVAVGHALKTIGDLGLEIFLAWSKRRPDGSVPRNYISDNDVKQRWGSFKPSRTSLAMVFRKASECGWKGQTPFALGSNSHTELARYIQADIKLREPCPIFVNEELWRFTGTHWSRTENHEQRLWIQELDGARYDKNGIVRANKSLIDGVLSELHAMCTVPNFFDEPPLGINCLSGFIQLSLGKAPVLIKHSPEQRQRFCINASWPAKAQTASTPLTEMFFTGICGQGPLGQEKRTLLEEILGAACAGLGTRLKVPKAFVLHGSSAQNGKSEYIKLLRGILPVGSHSAIAPSDMGKEQFLADLAGKVVNLTSELSSTRAIASDKMKAVISGDVVAAKRVYHPVFQFKPNALHVFAANILPIFRDGVDEGIRRRFIVIPFEHKIEESKIVTDIAAKILKTEMEVILLIAVEGATRLLAKGQYSLPDWIIKETEAWFEDADNLGSWLEDEGIVRLANHKNGISYADAFTSFREHMDAIDPREYVPRFPVFRRVVRQYVEENPELEIVRLSAGYRIIKRLLV
jgi:P4 family phage/plasmid primase-like protien